MNGIGTACLLIKDKGKLTHIVCKVTELNRIGLSAYKRLRQNQVNKMIGSIIILAGSSRPGFLIPVLTKL